MLLSNKPSPAKWLLSLSLILFAIISCKKEILQEQDIPDIAALTIPGINAKEASKKMFVRDISGLYAAINDATNVGSTIVLAPGTYLLSPGYPNAGRLELLENMRLLGQTGHPEQVIIDASALPGISFVPPNNFPAPRTGAIRMGRGYNAIEWLTVKGNASTQAFSVIDTDLIWAGVSKICVSHCIVNGGRTGIDIRNISVASIGRILDAKIANNEIFENIVQQGVGILVQNANGASGAVIRVSLDGNYVHGNKVGFRSFNVAPGISTTKSASISIESNAERFEENGLGIILFAALSEGSTSNANGNSLVFEAHGTTIRNNVGALPPEPNPSCGIYVIGGFKLGVGEASKNHLKMNLWGCSINGNEGVADIVAYGASSLTATPAGINNEVEMGLSGVSKHATTLSVASFPAEPGETNTVSISR
jgi:hypothetical protein